MDSEHDPKDSADEATAAHDDDNPTPSEDAGQKGAGTATGAIGGMEDGTEPGDQDERRHEKP